MSEEGALAVITGGGQGLGREYARTLSQRGWRVILADVAGELAITAAKSITEDGGVAYGVHIDVSDPESVAQTFNVVTEEHGPVTGLVNNAGGAFITPSDIEDMEYDDFTRVIGVNAGGTWLCTQAVARS